MKSQEEVEASHWQGGAIRGLGGRISFAEFDASIHGWINHVRYADSWGLRRYVLQDFVW